MKAGKIDWKLIAGIDVDRLQSADFGSKEWGILQETLMGIAFFEPTSEMAQMPPEMLKVFRIAQLTIQYLLHSQEMLTQAVHQLNADNGVTHREMEKMSKKYAEAQHQIKTLKIECKRRKQTIETQQECLLRGENLGSFQKCQLCGKTFVNLTFLDSHMARRHPDNRKKLDDDQQGEESDVKEQEDAELTKIRELTHKFLGQMIKREVDLGEPSQLLPPNAIEELRFVIKRQELEIQNLQEKLEQMKTSMEHDRGKLTSQERFWQARLLSSEAEHRLELSAIYKQLAVLKATTEDAKVDLNVVTTTRQEHKALQIPQPADRSSKKLEEFQPEQDEEEEKFDKEEELKSCRLQQEDFENSQQELHEYASIQSLLEELDHHCIQDPNFLVKYREDASYRLKSILERDFGIHCNDDILEGIEDLQLTQALSQLKERRRSQRDANKDAKLLSSLRKQCLNEVEALLQEDQRDWSSSSGFGRRMTSLRKSLLAIWRQKRKGGSKTAAAAKNLDISPSIGESDGKSAIKAAGAAEPNLYVECCPIPAPRQKVNKKEEEAEVTRTEHFEDTFLKELTSVDSSCSSRLPSKEEVSVQVHDFEEEEVSKKVERSYSSRPGSSKIDHLKTQIELQMEEHKRKKKMYREDDDIEIEELC